MPSRSYYMLIASLPHLPPTFEVDRTPITRPRLEERLRMLHAKDVEVLEQVAAFLAWDRQPVDRTDDEVIERYDHLMETITNPLVRRVVNQRIDKRVIISALRRRKAGEDPPEGVGQHVDHIRRNWTEPEFNLLGRCPWIAEFNRLIADGEVRNAERYMFADNYTVWSRMAERYTFSFEAIILYLARWEIIDRWTSQNADTGRQRFDNMITETLGDYANLY